MINKIKNIPVAADDVHGRTLSNNTHFTLSKRPDSVPKAELKEL